MKKTLKTLAAISLCAAISACALPLALVPAFGETQTTTALSAEETTTAITDETTASAPEESTAVITTELTTAEVTTASGPVEPTKPVIPTLPPVEYTVTFVMFGATNYPLSMKAVGGKYFTVPTDNAYIFGFRLAGFAESANDYKVKYKPGDKIFITGDLTLYSLWGEKPCTRGDVNYDDKIDTADARLALRVAVGLETDARMKKAADYNGNGSADTGDARNILRTAVGLPVEELSPEYPAGFYEKEPVDLTNAKLTGYTAKDFPIYELNGITYIDGVIVVNKTYSLPEKYAPGRLTDACSAAFYDMQAAAYAEGLSLYASSGYRSYSTQKDLYARYVRQDGQTAADTYSARAGHSEHQTGLAIDLNTITNSFANTAEGKWVAENAWKYGFILRYPKDDAAKTGFIYEPWHIRYVGSEVAEKLYHAGLCFEEYYGISSAYAD